MFRDAQRFMWLVKRERDPQDARGLYWREVSQRALDESRQDTALSDKLIEKP